MKSFARHLCVYLLIFLMNYFIHVALGVLRIKALYNSAFIFGLFNETSYFIRIVATSVMLGVLTTLACYFYAFLSSQLQTLKWGMTILLAGVAGNAFEKLMTGYVLDYLSFNVGPLAQFYFNVNDVLQIIGVSIIVREIFKQQKIIWFPDTIKRKKLILYKDIQVPMTTKILGLFFIGSLTQGILAVALLFPQLKRGSQDVQVLFILCLVVLNLLLLPLIGRFFLRELLRSMGPVYALEKYLSGTESLEKPLKFRTTDHFKSLESAFNSFVDKHIRSKNP